MQYKVLIFLIFLYATPPRLGSDGERADGGLKATAAGTVCLQTHAVARRRFLPFGRRHRNRSGGFCCFSTPKSREKSFPELYAESSRGFRKVAVLTNFFLLVLLGPKVPKASARRFPRDCAIRGAARGAQDRSLSATPWRTRRSPHPLSPRQTRVRIYCAASGGIIIQCALEARINLLVLPASGCVSLLFRKTNHPRNSIFSFSARRFPTWFRWRKSGRRAESDSGGDGLLANPRIVARRRFQTSGRRHRNRSGGFCCFSPLKSS